MFNGAVGEAAVVCAAPARGHGDEGRHCRQAHRHPVPQDIHPETRKRQVGPEPCPGLDNFPVIRMGSLLLVGKMYSLQIFSVFSSPILWASQTCHLSAQLRYDLNSDK